MRERSQLELLDQFAASYRAEYDALPFEHPGRPCRFFVNNGVFESVDAEMLYCIIRNFRPHRIIEIGSGFSTLLAAQAAIVNRDLDAPCELTAIEPFPSPPLANPLPGLTRLVRTGVEDVALDKFRQLEANDILFIDSSHVLRIGGDVVREYLEILPSLRPGVIIHCHDIYLPADYPKELVLGDRNFWTEQYLLHAFLQFNRAFEVLWAASYMHLHYPDRLASAFTSYSRGSFWPKSFWMRRVAS